MKRGTKSGAVGLSRWSELDLERVSTRATDARVRFVLEWFQHEDRAKQPIRIDALARAVRISRSRLSHLFTQQIGMPVNRYVKLLRLGRARELLEKSFLEVKEISAHVGFNDVSHFVRDYKCVYNETPSQTRAASR